MHELPESAYRYVTDRELAVRYSVDRSTVWRWVRECKLPEPIGFNGSSRWWLPALIEWELEKGLLPKDQDSD